MNTPTTRFRDLPIGASFDFVDDSRPGYNSFFNRVVKITSRRYVDAAKYSPRGTAWRDMYVVGSINARVFHVELPPVAK